MSILHKIMNCPNRWNEWIKLWTDLSNIVISGFCPYSSLCTRWACWPTWCRPWRPGPGLPSGLGRRRPFRFGELCFKHASNLWHITYSNNKLLRWPHKGQILSFYGTSWWFYIKYSCIGVFCVCVYTIWNKCSIIYICIICPIQVPSYFVIKPWFADSLDPPAASTQSSQSISTSVHLQGSLPKFSLETCVFFISLWFLILFLCFHLKMKMIT